MKHMRYINLYKTHIFTGLILVTLLVSSSLSSRAQEKKPGRMATVSIQVADEEGNPIPDARVLIAGSDLFVQKKEDNTIAFNAPAYDFITLVASGYENKTVSVEEIMKDNRVILSKTGIFLTEEDQVSLPFSIRHKRNITGSYQILSGNILEKYPTNDIRNSMTGLANGVEIRELNGQPGISAEEELGLYNITEKVSVTTRGRSLMYVIDDVPLNVTEMPLDPSDISSMTIIKDIAGKAMYGPMGANGIVFIRTKRGIPRQRALTVDYEYGVNQMGIMPGWVEGADYARLNNQARLADGLEANYTENDIASYAKNDPYDMVHPSINFRDMMLKNSRSFQRANVSSTGGNDNFQYFSSLGYSGEGDNYKIGSEADYNRINMRSNIDVKVTDQVKLQFDIFGNLTYRRSPNFGYNASYATESNADMHIIEMTAVMNDITTLPPVAFPVYAGYDEENNVPWFGVSSVYKTNPIGDLTNNGFYTETGRNASTNAALDYDMGNLIKGLKSRTFFGFNVFNLTRIGKAEDYIAYIATPSLSPKTGIDTVLLSKVHNGFDMADKVKLHDYYFQRFVAYENLSYERKSGLNDIQGSFTFYGTKNFKNGVEEPERTLSGILSGSYGYNDRYFVNGVLNYGGTYSFAKDKRWRLFPTLGLGWVISEEDFMSDANFVDFLKIRAEGGVIGNERFLTPYYYSDSWTVNTSGTAFGPFTSNQWFGSTTDASVPRSNLNRIGNPDLNWETFTEFSAGIDGMFFRRKLALEVNYYNSLRKGQILRVANQIPDVAGLSAANPYLNFNDTRYFGVETSLQYTGNAGNFGYSFGGNATLQNSKILEYDEPDYRYDYRSRIGKPADTYFGHTYLGKYSSDAETKVIPSLYDIELKEGDLKYLDMNSDGFIDDNDISSIGHTSPRLFYALNARFSYKNLELFVSGTGRAFYDISLTNKYFWNGWGDNNYSEFVRDNIGGAYPRLTYYKVNNNFLASDFWLQKGGYFKIQNAELAYNLPPKLLQPVNFRGVRLYIRGANLFTFSKIKDVDPESISSGITTYPLFRTFTFGVKFNL